MTETPPPRRALATFLRRPAAKDVPSSSEPQAPEDAQADRLVTSSDTPATTVADTAPHAPPAPDAEVATPVDTADSTAALGSGESIEPSESIEPIEPIASTAPVNETVSPADDTLTAEAEAAPAAEALPATNGELPATAWHAAALPLATTAAAAASTPNFARAPVRVRAPRTPAWQWCVLLLLGLLLVLQILLADRARLSADARWRPLLTTLCGVLHCDLPLWHEPSAFTMLDRDVRPAPGEAGVLRIQASFRNDARWNQAWPWLQLSLSDADGRVIGSRVFSPTEYLGRAPDPAQTLAPGQSGRIDFRVREPAAGTAAFTFDFH